MTRDSCVVSNLKILFSVWFKIVQHFYNLNHPRINKLQDRRISDEWMCKNPSIKMKTFSSFRSNMFNRHMISDAKNIFIVGCENNLEDIYVTIDVRYWGITTSYLSVIITSYQTQGLQESRVRESQTEPVMYTHLYCLCSLWFRWNKALCFTVATC
jgi:hypothetical protein